MQYYLTGAGHFGFGFIVGSLLFFGLIIVKRKSLAVQTYAPFMPFVLGVVAAIPYVFSPKETCEFPVYINVFLFYPWVHCQNLVAGFLGNLHLVAVICGFIYCLIVLHYIRLVKRVRRHGWNARRRT